VTRCQLRYLSATAAGAGEVQATKTGIDGAAGGAPSCRNSDAKPVRRTATSRAGGRERLTSRAPAR